MISPGGLSLAEDSNLFCLENQRKDQKQGKRVENDRFILIKYRKINNSITNGRQRIEITRKNFNLFSKNPRIKIP